MKYRRTIEEKNKRCEKLEELGFTILHLDSRVGVSMTDGSYLEMDFSSIDETKFLQSAIKQAYEQGFENGKNAIRHELKHILKIK